MFAYLSFSLYRARFLFDVPVEPPLSEPTTRLLISEARSLFPHLSKIYQQGL
jgi:hypothetical protein